VGKNKTRERKRRDVLALILFSNLKKTPKTDEKGIGREERGTSTISRSISGEGREDYETKASIEGD